mgnify:CR=1 FL=1
MNWEKMIVAAHTAVTDEVSHIQQMKSDRYFVWQEDGANDFLAGNRHLEKAVTGTTDLYTKLENDPWKEAFENSLDALEIFWFLNSVQFEEETGFTHYEWVWEVPCG